MKGRSFILPALTLTAAIFACAIYANLSFAITDVANFKYFPPFRAGQNANTNGHLGAEYFNIAKAMVAGQGFANVFGEQTGATAWMPPVLPSILASLLWAFDNDRDMVMVVIVFLQVWVLIGTGLIVISVANGTTGRLGAWSAAGIYFIWVLNDFFMWFQRTHDHWLILLALDIVLAGFWWFEPLRTKKSAAQWGLCGGVIAMINPIVAFVWGMLSLGRAFRQKAWSQLIFAGLVCGLTLTPWTVRNYLLFGRLIPVKSNLAYELYQSQCITPDGLLSPEAWAVHPYGNAGRERQEFKKLGEMAFLDRKKELFWQSASSDPMEFADRVACRFIGVMLWYTPFNRAEENRRPWIFWSARLTHLLPFLSLLLLVFVGIKDGLAPIQWSVIGIYVLYLAPYIAVSYYDRYGAPLVGVKALLVIWGLDRLLAPYPIGFHGGGQAASQNGKVFCLRAGQSSALIPRNKPALRACRLWC